MRVSEAFPSDYLRAADLRGNNVRVVIDRVEMKDIGDDVKPVVFFQNKDKGVVLNKTNANNIAALYGDDTDDWIGKEVVLYPTMVDFQGRSVEAIRIRGLRPVERKPTAAKSAQQPNAAKAAPQYDELNPPPADDVQF